MFWLLFVITIAACIWDRIWVKKITKEVILLKVEIQTLKVKETETAKVIEEKMTEIEHLLLALRTSLQTFSEFNKTY